jgi:mRNA interferase MazF
LVLLDTGDDDILVARITAQVRQDDFDCELKNWADAGLRVPSTVRLHKLATLKKTLVERTLGRLSSADADCICQTLSRMATALKAIP